MAVHAEHRKSGYGRQLMTAAIAVARELAPAAGIVLPDCTARGAEAKAQAARVVDDMTQVVTHPAEALEVAVHEALGLGGGDA